MGRWWIVCLVVPWLTGAVPLATNYVAGRLIQLNDNGAWSWFMDERAIGIKDSMVFMPIPQHEIDLDPALGQNPGY